LTFLSRSNLSQKPQQIAKSVKKIFFSRTTSARVEQKAVS
jgi:hypothetical protein